MFAVRCVLCVAVRCLLRVVCLLSSGCRVYACYCFVVVMLVGCFLFVECSLLFVEC